MDLARLFYVDIFAAVVVAMPSLLVVMFALDRLPAKAKKTARGASSAHAAAAARS